MEKYPPLKFSWEYDKHIMESVARIFAYGSFIIGNEKAFSCKVTCNWKKIGIGIFCYKNHGEHHAGNKSKPLEPSILVHRHKKII